MSARNTFLDASAGPRKARHGTRTALYLRVSTADQKPDLQYDGLRGYAARAGLDIVQDYCDVAMSGRREGRPQLNALMTAARRRDIDCVLVWKFDRFARSTRHLLMALEEFDHLGVRFVSVQDQVDTDSPMGRAMFTIIGAMAELKSRSSASASPQACGRPRRAANTSGGPPSRSASSARSRPSRPRPTSVSVKSRPRSQAGPAAASSARSPNVPARPRHRAREDFCTYPQPTPANATFAFRMPARFATRIAQLFSDEPLTGRVRMTLAAS